MNCSLSIWGNKTRDAEILLRPYSLEKVELRSKPGLSSAQWVFLPQLNWSRKPENRDQQRGKEVG